MGDHHERDLEMNALSGGDNLCACDAFHPISNSATFISWSSSSSLSSSPHVASVGSLSFDDRTSLIFRGKRKAAPQLPIAQQENSRTASKDIDQTLEIGHLLLLQTSIIRESILLSMIVLSCGIFWIFLRWFPTLYTLFRFKILPQSRSSASTADHVLCYPRDVSSPGPELCKIKTIEIDGHPPQRYFEWRYEKFWYQEGSSTDHGECGRWTRKYFDISTAHPNHVHKLAANRAIEALNGLDHLRSNRVKLYGFNKLDLVTKSFIHILADEAIRPFFIFQVFSMSVWFAEGYIVYAIAIMVMSICSILATSYSSWSNIMRLHETAADMSNGDADRLELALNDHTPLPTLRAKPCNVTDLMPGDLIKVTYPMTAPCDFIIISGNVVVNESILTGESVPVIKSAIPYDSFLDEKSDGNDVLEKRSSSPRDSLSDSKHVVHCGTTIIQSKPQGTVLCNRYSLPSKGKQPSQFPVPETLWQFAMEEGIKAIRSSMDDGSASEEKNLEIQQQIRNYRESVQSSDRPLPVIGLVIRTGFCTSKGNLLRSILFCPAPAFSFQRQTLHFLLFLIIGTIGGCIATVIFSTQSGSTLTSKDILLRCLNLATVAIPPALPLALSITVLVSSWSLRKKGIRCIDSDSIVLAGRVNLLCFDKTGTLTKDSITLCGVKLPAIPSVSLSSLTGINDAQQILLEDAVSDASTLYSKSSMLPHRNALFYNPLGATLLQQIHSCRAGMCYVLAACHSISVLDQIEQSDSAKSYDESGHQRSFYVGDPLEIEIFEASGWKFGSRFSQFKGPLSRYNEIWSRTSVPSIIDTLFVPKTPSDGDEAIGIVRKFEFDPALRRMGCIVMHIPLIETMDIPKFSLIVKGAPEEIQSICRSKTIPTDLNGEIRKLTLKGNRILGCAFRPFTLDDFQITLTSYAVDLEMQSQMLRFLLQSPRQSLESDAYFCGLIITENKLKENTIHYLKNYTRAGLRSIMVTGDHILTAVSMAEKCTSCFLNPKRKTIVVEYDGNRAEGSRLLAREVGDHLHAYPLQNIIHARNEVSSAVLLDSFMAKDFKISNEEDSLEITKLVADGLNIAVTGAAFEELIRQHETTLTSTSPGSGKNKRMKWTLLEVVLAKANVFARMTPHSKKALMNYLQALGYVVCMTGDGANDSAALKAADVGISIRANEINSYDSIYADSTSIVAAPFSTDTADIGAVEALLTEGRSCLVSTFSMFRFMFCYGVIQFTSVLLLYRHHLELADNQYLWIDLGLVFPYTILMPTLRAKSRLSPGRPESNLLSTAMAFSVIGTTIVLASFQVACMEWLLSSGSRVNDGSVDIHCNLESTQSFLFSNFQYVAVAFSLSQNYGLYRSPLWNNPALSLMICFGFIICTIFLLFPEADAKHIFCLEDMPSSTRWTIWLVALCNTVAIVIYERFFVHHKSLDEEPREVRELREVLNDIEEDPEKHGNGCKVYEERLIADAWLPDTRIQRPAYSIVETHSAPIWAAMADLEL